MGPSKNLAAATIPADKKLYQREIEASDEQIDALVYELCGLTEEQIAILRGRGDSGTERSDAVQGGPVI